MMEMPKDFYDTLKNSVIDSYKNRLSKNNIKKLEEYYDSKYDSWKYNPIEKVIKLMTDYLNTVL